jgi:hypothetical protein
MEHREDADAGWRKAIDDAVTAVDHLAKVVALKLGDDAAGQGKALQAIDGREELINEEFGIMRGVARDEAVDLAEVIPRGDDPLDGILRGVDHVRFEVGACRQRPNWRLTSSCGMTRPASASARPRSIL